MLGLLLVACAGRPPENRLPIVPRFKEFQVSTQALSLAAQMAMHNADYSLEPDSRRATPDHLITLQQPIPLKRLKALAYPGLPGIRGKPVNASLHVLITIRPSYAREGYSRVTIQPVFMVYLSMWRDRRQWIEWRSNGTLEQDLLTLIEVYLHREDRL